MNIRTLAVLSAALGLASGAIGCRSKGDAVPAPAPEATAAAPEVEQKLTLGASLSLTGSLAREGGLTKEGYELCAKIVNDKGGVSVGGKSLKLDIQYSD